jgi:hypothetical protein
LASPRYYEAAFTGNGQQVSAAPNMIGQSFPLVFHPLDFGAKSHGREKVAGRLKSCSIVRNPNQPVIDLRLAGLTRNTPDSSVRSFISGDAMNIT